MTQRHEHLTPERFQSLLDGELPAGEANGLRAEIESCARCSSEFEAWQLVFEDLGELPRLQPSAAFRQRVMDRVPTRRTPVLQGLGRRRDPAGHLAPGQIQEYLDGRLRGRAARKLEGHLDTCAVCRTEADGLHALSVQLESLPRLAPSEGFAERVMAGVRVQQMAALVESPTTRHGRFVEWVRTHLPRPVRSWPALIGAGTAPAVVAALVLQALFSHELFTVGSLVSFLGFKLSGLLTSAAAAGNAWMADNPLAAQAWGLVLDVGASPALAAALATGVSGLLLGALWIVYRNVIAPGGGEGGYVEATL